MTIPKEMLRQLCPMHVLVDPEGRITQAGPTLCKLVEQPPEGVAFFDLFEISRPRAVDSMADLLHCEGRKLHLRLRHGTRMAIKGQLAPDGRGGAVVNLSFGIGVMEAVRQFSLSGTDFAHTDLAIEMLYLMEAKSAAMEASRRLNTRLQGAMLAAQERAFTDTLTGLCNRRALDHLLARLARVRGPFAFLHLDLDWFKQVNDTLGHAAGDEVLRTVATILQDETRKDDMCARVGGDEFVIVMANAVTRPRLAGLARRIIAQIERPVPFEGRSCRVSASIGISLCADGDRRPYRVLEEADVALYAAKRAGRARFAFFDGTAAERAHPSGPDDVASFRQGGS